MAKRIVVIDDDETMRELFDFFLTDEGWEVFTYDYARASLEVVRKLSPDLIILDINVVQAGASWSFLQLFRMEDVTARIPVIVCTTAMTLSLEIEGYLAAQHVSIVRKPFDIDAFILTVQQNFILDLALPILVVAANEDLSDVITTILRVSGYLVVTASNGLAVLDPVEKSQYSLILLDMATPVTTGLEFLAALAQRAEPRSPVILLGTQSNLVTEHLPAFVIDVLAKPFDLNHLVKLVGNYVQPVSSPVVTQHEIASACDRSA